jgi:hypothetical protein
VNDDTPDPGVVKEEITLPDGRYLIYYTFADEPIGDGRSADAPGEGAPGDDVILSSSDVILSSSKDEPTP